MSSKHHYRIFDDEGAATEALVADLILDTALTPGQRLILTAPSTAPGRQIIQPGVWSIAKGRVEVLVSPTYGAMPLKMVAFKDADVPVFATPEEEWAFIEKWSARKPSLA